MRKINLWKVCCNTIKRLWLPTLLALIGAAVSSSLIQPAPIQWELNAVYLVEIRQPDEKSIDYDTYLYEVQLANAVSQMLNINMGNENITNFTVSPSNRRIYVSGKNQSEEQLQLSIDQIEIYARECLQKEVGNGANLQKEQCVTIEQEDSGFESERRQFTLLGGLIGLCVGLAILLLLEYVKSPLIQEIPAKQEGKL